MNRMWSRLSGKTTSGFLRELWGLYILLGIIWLGHSLSPLSLSLPLPLPLPTHDSLSLRDSSLIMLRRYITAFARPFEKKLFPLSAHRLSFAFSINDFLRYNLFMIFTDFSLPFLSMTFRDIIFSIWEMISKEKSFLRNIILLISIQFTSMIDNWCFTNQLIGSQILIIILIRYISLRKKVFLFYWKKSLCKILNLYII